MKFVFRLMIFVNTAFDSVMADKVFTVTMFIITLIKTLRQCQDRDYFDDHNVLRVVG